MLEPSNSHRQFRWFHPSDRHWNGDSGINSLARLDDKVGICLAQVSPRVPHIQRISAHGKTPTKSGASYHLAPGEICRLAFLFDRPRVLVFCYTLDRKLWIPRDVKAPEVARQLIATPKLMITIFWGVSGIHVVDYLPPGTSFDSTCFIDHILSDFNALPNISVAVRQRQKSVILMNDSQIHKSKSVIAKISSMPVQLAHHPSCSPNLAPSDFSRFDHLKFQIIGRDFNHPEDLIRSIWAVFLRMSRDTIKRVFDEWIDRVERCISHEGSYFPEE
jgi:hypothetical protein